MLFHLPLSTTHTSNSLTSPLLSLTIFATIANCTLSFKMFLEPSMECTSIVLPLLLTDMLLEIAKVALHKIVLQLVHLVFKFSTSLVGLKAQLQIQLCICRHGYWTLWFPMESIILLMQGLLFATHSLFLIGMFATIYKSGVEPMSGS